MQFSPSGKILLTQGTVVPPDLGRSCWARDEMEYTANVANVVPSRANTNSTLRLPLDGVGLNSGGTTVSSHS